MNLKRKLPFFKFFAFAVFLLLCAVGVLNFLTSENSSAEWIYTVEWINIVSLFSVIALLILWLPGKALTISLMLCAIFATIPAFANFYQNLDWPQQYLLSGCWIISFIAGGVFCFLAAARLSGAFSWALCGLGSIVFAFGVGEAFLLATSQNSDAISDVSYASVHAAPGATTEAQSWTEGQCGRTPGAPGSETRAVHRIKRFDEDLFDVEYNFNSAGWRKLPVADSDAENDLLIFGCSMAFGYGLNDEQTWAWRLAELLGPNWLVQNYAGSAYGANQMLCLLEKHLVAPLQGKNRYALFLAIEDHLIRNQFFSFMPHYRLTPRDEAESGGEPRYKWIHMLPVAFNGSQLAREIRNLGMGIKRKYPGDEADLYLAMIRRSADILRKQYKTELIVMLWPDLESLKNEIKSFGIPVVSAQPMLTGWNKTSPPGVSYYIKYPFESHPNAKASEELAEGLALYFGTLKQNSR